MDRRQFLSAATACSFAACGPCVPAADAASNRFTLEHGNSMKGVAGEQAVIEAYRAVDPA